MYESGRYISSSEAVWRILTFPIHERFPPVTQLAVHLENGQRVYFTSTNLRDTHHNTPPQTTLLAFFEICKTDNFAKTLLYHEVPSYYVYNNKTFSRRKLGKVVEGWPGVKKEKVLGRVYTIHPNNTECYHLRLLLHVVRGPTCFEDLKTVNGVLHPTFQSACKALGLHEDDSHWDTTLEEAALCDSPLKLRELFTVMLIFCQLSDPLSLWEKFKDSFSEDIKRQLERDLLDSAQRLMDEVYNRCLILIEDAVLAQAGQDIGQYGLPRPKRSGASFGNREYLRETNYDLGALREVVLSNEETMTNEQNYIYQQILGNIDKKKGIMFFLDAPGGTGKTFLINLLLAKVRSNRGIALAVASSGIAATLLQGGKTAHAAFKLPLNLTNIETPLCNISKQSNTAHVLRDCKLIVWDESTMAHKRGFEALNITLKDIRGNDDMMGGVTVLLAGDFRQTLPVVPKGTRANEVKACIKASNLWPFVKKLHLTKNMRVYLKGDVCTGQFADLLLKIGNGEYPETEGKITITSDLAVVVSTIDDLITRIYPDIHNLNSKSTDWLCERTILTTKNDQSSAINDILLRSFEGPEHEYRSVDTVVHTDDAVHYPVEFLNSLNPPGLPPHTLTIKVGAPVMLLRNLNPPKLCNGTRLRVKALHKNVIEAIIFTGCARGESVFIPRIPLIPTDYPFEFKRLQIPLKTCFAMTINKAQDQSLKTAGIDLRGNCFSHGQFYVACSRVSSPSNLVVLAPEGRTCNVVYKEVL
ncbi:ATP-dependent DNA helicase RRM3-like [Sitophilus oryzae]|uniref:ATP-dependent DNA helicase n=1 Tax=Sitophilus oryzae TaxID=7048 RepID=A0A6J2YIG3_SITOR|nr:ATP-dependent DNA helicase RRM3-like [Sitophilus oryzae]